MIPTIISTLADYAGYITSIIAFVILFVKPIREKIFGQRMVQEGQKCLLRSEMVRTYYKHLEDNELHQYEYENVCLCYKAYKELGGNSFIDHIYNEMQEWTVIQ